jgi:hypothetical protein
LIIKGFFYLNQTRTIKKTISNLDCNGDRTGADSHPSNLSKDPTIHPPWLRTGRMTILDMVEWSGGPYALRAIYRTNSPPGPAASWLIQRFQQQPDADIQVTPPVRKGGKTRKTKRPNR